MTAPTRRELLLAGLAAPALLTARPLLAAEPEIFIRRGAAIGGTDTVAYFAGDGPVPGQKAHKVEWRGAEWHFADPANAETFATDPTAHAPQFGGYCAYALSKGSLAPSVPEAWTLHRDQLFLNASLRARELWLEDMEANIAKAREYWPGILG